MLRKLISDLLAARRKAEHKACGSSTREHSIADRATSNHGDKAIGLSPADFLRRAETLVAAGRLAAALECYKACVRTYRGAVDAYVGMGNVLVDLWSLEEAVAAYSKALELAQRSSIFSAVLFHSHYLSAANRQATFDRHRQFGSMMSMPSPRAFALSPDPDRRIRIGYVSPNFTRHSVGYFVEPVLQHHDRERYEVYCYHNHRMSDDTTARIRGLSHAWRDISHANDDAVEELIRNDAIDILVDLAGHSKGNRLGVFARKPAPLQMTWLGYPDTTGLRTVDFRITDRITDPRPDAEQWYTERLLHIDNLFLCYQPPADSPPVERSRRRESEVVFCSFNNIAKVNDDTVRLWSRILAEVPTSRLVIKSASLGFADTVDRALECFERNGVAADRLELRGWINDRQNHLELYNTADIALDTFPYNGTTTTCEALWMGVPVVSRAGAAHMSRVGAAILGCAGLHDLVAQTEAEYVDIAIGLALDRARRMSLRAGLRNTLLSSPLLDQAGFTRRLERQFRTAWASWCDLPRFN